MKKSECISQVKQFLYIFSFKKYNQTQQIFLRKGEVPL